MRQSRLIGIGNPDRGDDAAGLLLAQNLAGQSLPGVEVVSLYGDLAPLLDHLAGVERVVLVDAARGGGDPGGWRRFDLRRESLSPGVGSTGHSLSLEEIVALAAAMERLPSRLVLYAVFGKEFALGAPLSAAVRRALPTLQAAVVAELGA